MGIFAFFKQALADRKAMKADFREMKKREEAYLQMPAAVLSQLTDDELMNAVWVRANRIVFSKENLAEGFDLLNEEQRVFYAVNLLEMEVNNGGLCQFFVNASRIAAPLISEYLGMLGATQHQKLYDGFITKHQIDIHELSSFDSDTLEAFQTQYARYPFEEYDDAFYELESLRDDLLPYVKRNIAKF